MDVYKYYTHEEPKKLDWLHEIDVPNTDADELDWIAEKAADDYYSNCDGWESQWPVVFYIYDANNKFLGQKSVEIEYTPSFSAYEVTA